MFASKVKIKQNYIGNKEPVYVVAELSANHHGSYEKTLELIKVAATAGADAVKIQTFTADTLTLAAEQDCFTLTESAWQGRKLHDLYSEAQMPWEWQPKLKDFAENLGLTLFSTPFAHSAVDFLQKMNIPAYKIASFELVDLPLLRRVAACGMPVIMSTGMATLTEIEEAVSTLSESGCNELIILKCTSAYPAPAEENNLRTIPDLQKRFNLPIGFSDHTLGTEAAIAAVSLGACLVEKHLTLDRKTGGPDAGFSAEPKEFVEMINSIRKVEKMLGLVSYAPGSEEKKLVNLRRSLFVVENMEQGDYFNTKNVRSIRPGDGLHTRYLEKIIGQQARCNITRGTPLSWDLVGENNE